MSDSRIGPNFPRSEQDVIARMHEVLLNSLGWEVDVLLDYLNFDAAKPFLRDEVTREQWEAPLGEFAGYGGPTDAVRPVALTDSAHMLTAAEKYAEFGWGKIAGECSVSASRTIDKMRGWLWLLGWDPAEIIDSRDYGDYGAPQLTAVCEVLGFSTPKDEA